MEPTSLSFRCYILPVVGGITYVLLSLPTVVAAFEQWIPDYYYAMVTKALILVIILFITCRIMDLVWTDMCHDDNCIFAAHCECHTEALTVDDLSTEE